MTDDNAARHAGRERFLGLLLDRLTAPGGLDDADETTAMLRELAELLSTSGAYVVMIATDGQGAASIEARHAWYDSDVEPLDLGDRRIEEIELVFRAGPLVIADSALLPPVADVFRSELERRGLRSTLVQPVFHGDRLRGIVGFNHREPREWTATDLEVAAQLGRLVVGVLDKEQADRTLADAQRRIRSFITASPIPVYCWEFPEPISVELPIDRQLDAIWSGVLVECNEAFAGEYELGAVDDAIGRMLGDVARIDPDGFRYDLRHLIENDYRNLDHTTVSTRADGQTAVFVSNSTGFVEDGHLYRIWGNARNVTDMAAAYDEIESSRARIDVAIEAGGLGFFEWTPAKESGTFEFPVGFGDGFPRRLEIADLDTARRAIGPENVATLMQALNDTRDDLARVTAEIAVPGGDAERSLLFQGSWVGDNDGRRIVGVIQDITDVRRAEAARHELEEQRRMAQKLEGLGLLAGGIAHDFNNLLMGILGNVDLATQDLPAQSSARNHLEEVENAARLASDLCRQMLAYAGKGSFVLEAIDVESVIEDMHGLLESSIDRRLSLRFDFGNAPPIVADASQIQQVVLNLVINAGEASGPEGGEVVVSTGVMTCDSDDLSEPYIGDDLEPGDYTYIEVSDRGAGMSEEVLQRLFDPFFSTKFTGRGLGMSAVLGIVRGHDGSIKVDTEEGRGTTVRVFFRAHSDRQPIAASPTEGDDRELATDGVVLLVDDDPRIRSVGIAMLERIGYVAIAAENGREALRLFDELADEVVAIVLDLTMPNMDGSETFREFHRRQPGVKVILTSGYNEQQATREFVGRGLAAFLQKPFSLADLRRTLADVI